MDYPNYYEMNFTHAFSAVQTPLSDAVRVEVGDRVAEGRPYYYEVVIGTWQPQTFTYYFRAVVSGIFDGWRNDSARYYAYILQDQSVYELDAVDSVEVITVSLKEKPLYRVTMTGITGKGSYDVTLPEGAYETVGSDNRTVVTLYEGDTFTALVTPEQKWTVSYWEVSTEVGETSRTRATSLKYTIPEVQQNFTFTPIFSATTYNTISWPTIDKNLNGLTLSPLSGYLYRVAAGGSFKFKLSGSTLDLVKQVYVNGEPFIPEGEEGSDYTYTGEGAERVYTISNIQANKVITLELNPIGVTVNNSDIVQMSGTGWVYDHNT